LFPLNLQGFENLECLTAQQIKFLLKNENDFASAPRQKCLLPAKYICYTNAENVHNFHFPETACNHLFPGCKCGKIRHIPVVLLQRPFPVALGRFEIK
jgi:hypothetical protein